MSKTPGNTTKPEPIMGLPPPKRQRKAVKQTSLVDGPLNPIQLTADEKELQRLQDSKKAALLDNKAARPTLKDPEIVQKEQEVAAAKRQAEDDQLTTPLKQTTPGNVKQRLEEGKERQREHREQHLTADQWAAVAKAFKHTGVVNEIVSATQLPAADVRHLLNCGITRLGLPGVKPHFQDQANLQLAPQQKQETALLNLKSDDVAAAVQGRVTQEAAAARDFLHQTINSSTIVNGYVKALLQRLATGESELFIPEVVTLDTLDSLSKVIDAQSRATERAVKLVRLTQGEPTEVIEQHVGMLLAMCTTDELEEAERTGGLPKRLTTRIGGSDPIENKDGRKATVIDTDSDTVSSARLGAEAISGLEQSEQPSWKSDIQPPEGGSSSDIDDE